MSGCLVYITASGHEEATVVGRDLVEKRLAACVNINQPVTSIYHWEGAVQEDVESVLIAKTTEDLVEALTARVAEIHSYNCPCVVAVPIAGGNKEFLKWIADETKQ
ncbi:MAG: Divalent-cation tolerance protein CutA [Alphaproteobacteria bacterium MarineAlpha4_Bin2]|nr:MAG: Divalent-cation tolerance protein CutA [Alphaproteobacteria bacterium MarineAlpha4_Bin2]